MKILIAAVNAKYIHTSLSVRSLYHYAKAENSEFAEFTINERAEDVLIEIYNRRCDAVLFSCYIWNIDFVIDVSERLKKISPDTQIIFGGPEVTYDSVYYMEKYPFIDAIICGEGEKTFSKWIKSGYDIPGMTFRRDGEIIQNPPGSLISDITSIPFPYDESEIDDIKNKLIYYESSRGCPFNCSYCLSSTIHGVRFRNIDLVKNELMFFIRHKVRIVKFVDRTFNADRKRTCELFRFLIENADETSFHFEIAADLINDEMLDILKTAPKNLLQFEIGVQSTNDQTICAIDRKTDFNKISHTVQLLKANTNVHVHLDLIAGLPYENLSSFKKSFDDVFALNPDVLQLGFLKLLRGTKIREEESKYSYKYTAKPPYEILCNAFVSFDDILLLKGVEDMFEKFYNSGVFCNAIAYLLRDYSSPFDFFRELWLFYSGKGYNREGHSRNGLYEILCEFEGGKSDVFRDFLKLDYFEHNKGAVTPKWSLIPYDRELLKLRFEILSDEFIRKYLPEYISVPKKEAVKFLHFERFCHDGEEKKDIIIIFDNKYNRTIKIR